MQISWIVAQIIDRLPQLGESPQASVAMSWGFQQERTTLI